MHRQDNRPSERDPRTGATPQRDIGPQKPSRGGPSPGWSEHTHVVLFLQTSRGEVALRKKSLVAWAVRRSGLAEPQGGRQRAERRDGAHERPEPERARGRARVDEAADEEARRAAERRDGEQHALRARAAAARAERSVGGGLEVR